MSGPLDSDGCAGEAPEAPALEHEGSKEPQQGAPGGLQGKPCAAMENSQMGEDFWGWNLHHLPKKIGAWVIGMNVHDWFSFSNRERKEDIRHMKYVVTRLVVDEQVVDWDGHCNQ